jgi:transposase-like protein
MVRNSLNFVSWKLQREVAADLRTIYTSSTVEVAEQMLSAFEAKWDKQYPSIGQSWRRNWAGRYRTTVIHFSSPCGSTSAGTVIRALLPPAVC